MIERQLADTLDRVAAAGPDESGAFDRFLRHRARRARRVAATTALALVAVVAAGVVLPRPDRDPDRRPRLYVSGVAGPERWQQGPLVAVAPLQGFEADVPAGWEASPTWKGLELRPVSAELRRRLGGPVQLGAHVLEERYSPAPNAWKDGTYTEDLDLPKAVRPGPRGRQSTGSFPGDLRWFRTDRQDGRWLTSQWHIAWPYRCRPGVRCPSPLALRTLRVAFQVEEGAAADVNGLAEHLLRSARPIANAVRGQTQAPRPDCQDGRQMVLKRGTDSSWPLGPNTMVIKFWWRARTTWNLVPCTVRGPLGVELLDRSGRRLDVAGNGRALWDVASLPESRSRYSGPGQMELGLKWINWCGQGPTFLRWLGDPASAPAARIGPPRCTDRSKPSRLSVEYLLR